MIFNSAENVPQYCDNTDWIAMTGGANIGAATDIISGLVGWWKLDETSGNAIDSEGGNDGTISGSVAYAPSGGQINGAADFSGGSIVISPDASINNLSPMTVCAWIYPNSLAGSGYPIILDKSSNFDADDGWNFYLRPDVETIGFMSDRLGFKERGSVSAGQWQHFCATWDGTDGNAGIKLYKNGVEATTGGQEGDVGADVDDSGNNLNIGKTGGGMYPFDGKIDDVRIYNRVLSSAEISKMHTSCSSGETVSILYNSAEHVPQFCNGTSWVSMTPDVLAAIPTGLVHHWTLDDDTAGTTLADSAGSSDCTLSGTRASVAGKDGNGIHFAGGGSDCGVISELNGVTEFTLTAWVKRTSAGNRMWLAKGSTDADSLGLEFWDDGNMYFELMSASAGWEEAYYTLDDTDWHHVAMVFDGSRTGNANRLKAWIDGRQVTLGFNNTIPNITPSSSATFELPGPADDNSIDDVRIYDHALTNDEIQYLYATTGGGFISRQTANGYFVEVGETDGNLGGLSGANSYCLSELSNGTWTGKATAQANNQLTAANVKAWLCDSSTCQDMEPFATYAYGSTSVDSGSGGGGGTFGADASGYLGDDGRSFGDSEAFDLGANFHEYFTGRDSGTQGPQAGTCSDWSSTSGSTYVGVSDSTYDEKISKYTKPCSEGRMIACIVGPVMADPPAGFLDGSSPCSAGQEGTMIYNGDDHVLQYCDGSNWRAIGKAQ